ncbi:MAG: rod shape-determining protein MreC [Clostridia bacterium]|nr:rod shape-determining protein MreC [Clostridia bacterium]
MRRKKPSLKKQLILCTCIALLLCLIPTILSLTSTKDFIRNTITTISSPLTKLFSAAGKSASDALASGDDYEKLQQQLNDANQELAALREQLAALEQLKQENDQLREYLELKDKQPTLALTDASIIYNNDPTGRTVTLNKGSRHGIAVGMPVLSAGGLYGTVSEVSASTCKVTTLKEETLFIGATVVRSGINGTLCGLQTGQTHAKLQYLDANVDHQTALQVGDVIVTSGYGEKYPHGLLIGEIVEIGVDSYDRSPYAYVRLYADYSSTATLMIVTGEKNENEMENEDSGNTEQNDKNSDQASGEVSGDGS